MGVPDHTLMRSRLFSGALVVSSSQGSAAQTLPGDDFETLALLKSSSPPGVWTASGSTEMANTITLSAAASHRGGAGMRLIDVTNGPGSGMVTWLEGSDVPDRAALLRAQRNRLSGDLRPPR